MKLRKAGANWVEGDRFFDRDAELEALTERVRDGIHTLLTAQRRMGKTSLVRELQRRLCEEGRFETIFVDLEDARTPADAIAEVAAQSRSAQSVWRRIVPGFANVLRGVSDRVDTLAISEVRIKLRAGVDTGNWRQKGDGIFAALAENERPVVLAIDELPILVNRMLKGHDYRITPEGRQSADEFLSWLRKNVQTHQGRVCLILSGSVSLEPVLRQAGLSAHANVFSPFDLKPWSEQTALACLAALSETYGLDLSPAVRRDMCDRLRCLVPHHVQRFFDHLHVHLRRVCRHEASLEDVAQVYTGEMLSVRGQVDMDHYESRLKLVLGSGGYRAALAMLTEAAVSDGVLHGTAIDQYREYFQTGTEIDAEAESETELVRVEDVLLVLEHDGYLAPRGGGCGDGYRFVSGLLEDWWRTRHGRHFVPVAQRFGAKGR